MPNIPISELTILLTLAIFLGLAIGFEREYISNKSAGTRTYALIVFGSTLFTLLSRYGFSDLFGITRGLDPSRITAGIVTGLGFLGTGVIMTNKDKIIGLTTAASIWASSAIGVAVGLGYIKLSIVATSLMIFTLLVIGWIEFLLKKNLKNTNNDSQNKSGKETK